MIMDFHDDGRRDLPSARSSRPCLRESVPTLGQTTHGRSAGTSDFEKPGFTPPTPAYPVAWTAIEASLAYGGYRLLRAEPSPERSKALALWTLNQVGIGGWSEVFFGYRAPGWGTLASAGLGISAVTYVAVATQTDKVAAGLGLPLVAWVTFATLLSEEIWRRNEPGTMS